MKNIIICGGGINGASVAYYLAKKGIKSTIVEQTGIACAASGKSGGFLAKDWSNGTDLEQLSTTSFGLHMELMKEFENCDYRKLDTLSITVQQGQRKSKKSDKLPDWVDGSITNCSTIGTEASTAQVHPFKLTNTFIKKAKELAGSEVKIGKVTSIEISSGNKVTAVKINKEETVPADIVVITMGPWSGKVKDWLNIPSIKGHRAHSIVLKPTTPISSHALFVEYSKNHHSPEIYPRPDNTVYVCGMSDDVNLPNTAAEIQPNLNSCKSLKEICGYVSKDLGNAEVLAEQACYLPISSSGLPIIGKISGVDGAFIGAGHSCWGILNAPATGAALAELIVDGQCSIVDLSPFDPQRFS